MDAISSNSACLVHTVDLPASGKSTWALKSGFDAAVSLDDCRQELWGDFTLQNGPGGISTLLVLQEKKIRRAMEQGQSIVVHNTHHLRKFRRPLTDLARQLGYSVQIVYFDVAPDECCRRNRKRRNPVPEKVMEEFIRTFEEPVDGEADRVVRFSEILTWKG